MSTLKDIEKTIDILEYLISRDIDSSDSKYEEFMILVSHGYSVDSAGYIVFGDMI